MSIRCAVLQPESRAAMAAAIWGVTSELPGRVVVIRPAAVSAVAEHMSSTIAERVSEARL